jgi:hypothetical protein
VFTFVIAASLLVVLGADPPASPTESPAGVFALLGLNAGSYVVLKGIQKADEQRKTGGIKARAAANATTARAKDAVARGAH